MEYQTNRADSSEMVGLIVIAVLALLLAAVLEPAHRHRSRVQAGLRGSSDADDRELARIKLDLLALAGRAEPFAHRPFVMPTRGSGAEPEQAIHVPAA
jgi:hypothetical protein